MAIGVNLLTSGTDDTLAASSFVSASITPSANALVLLAVGQRRTDSVSCVTPSAISGNGLTWVDAVGTGILLIDDTGSSRVGLTVYRALGTPSGGVITITLTESVYAGAWSVLEFTGVDLGGTNGSAAVLQAVKGTPAIATSASVTLAAFGDAANATYGAFAHRASEANSVGSGFTIGHDVATVTNPISLLTETKLANDTSVDASWATSTDGGGIALEIKAAGVASVASLLLPNPYYRLLPNLVR